MCPNTWYINCSRLTVVAGEEGLPVLTDFPSSLFPMRQSPKEKHQTNMSQQVIQLHSKKLCCCQ